MLLNRAAQFDKLHTLIKDAFPEYKIIVKSRTNIRSSFVKPELDIWIPKLQLGFEFREDDDKSKNHLQLKDYVRRLGVTLVSIPVWWNSSLEELHSTIQFARPDLSRLGPYSFLVDPVPTNPPPLFPLPAVIPGIGEFNYPQPETYASFTESIFKNSPWWISEKYESIRCLWSPDSQRLHCKGKLTLPHQYLKSLSKIKSKIDGEIWYGRDLLEPVDHYTYIQNWYQPLRFIARNLIGNESVLEKAHKMLLNTVPFEHDFIVVPPIKLATRMESILFLLQNIIESDGLGVLLQQPKSVYTDDTYEITTCDVEIDAIAISKTRKKCTVLLPFDVPLITFHNESGLVKAGDIVRLQLKEFSMKEYDATSPTLVKIRTGVLWEDSVRSIVNNDQLLDNEIKKEKDKRREYLKKVLTDYAHKRKLNPLIPETWYSASKLPKKIKKEQLKKIFPEIGLDDRQFSKTPKHYWEDINNRRQFYIDFAKKRDFDPLVGANWYSLSNQDITSAHGWSMLRYHKKSHTTAIKELFPNINFNPTAD